MNGNYLCLEVIYKESCIFYLALKTLNFWKSKVQYQYRQPKYEMNGDCSKKKMQATSGSWKIFPLLLTKNRTKL